MPVTKTYPFLPSQFQSEANKKFLNATLDQLVTEPNVRPVSGYVGRKFSPGNNDINNFIREPSLNRANYQLEPGIVYKNQNIYRNYGQNNVYNLTNFKTTTGTTETMFGPEVIRQWDTNDTAPNGNIQLPLGINYGGNSNVFTDSTGTTGTAYQYTGVKTKPKLIYNLGPQNLFIDTLGEVYDNTNKANKDEILIFIGYCGWDLGELKAELEEGSWTISDT